MSTSNGSAQGGVPVTILVVDDEPSVLALVRTMLWRAGYSVIEASTGEEALAVASSHKDAIRLLLTDVLMPEMNGYELAGKLKAQRPEVKILYMSGYRDMVLTESAGRPTKSAPLIRKPFTAHNLLAKIDQILKEEAVEA